MNDQDLIETLYPEPRPMTDSTRSSMRTELFGAAIDHPGHADDINVAAITEARGGVRGSRVTIAAAVIALIGVAGIWTAANRTGGDPSTPAGRPTTTSSDATIRQPTGSQVARPTSFPVLGELPDGQSVTASVDETGSGRTQPLTQALLARPIDDTLADAVVIAARSEPVDVFPQAGRTPTEAIVMGQPAVVHDESYAAYTIFTVTWGSGPYFVAQGEDPMALLDRASDDLVAVTESPDPERPPLLTFGVLPDDFEVVVPPHHAGGDSVSAALSIQPAGHRITVSTVNPLIAMSMTSPGDPLRRADVNGRPAWTSDAPDSVADVVWQVDDSTFAHLAVGDDSTTAEALDLARAITFVDIDTWTATYAPETTALTTSDPDDR